MKTLIILLTILSIFNYGCKNEKFALIENPSAEITDGSEVTGWTYNSENKNVIHYFDNEAHHGNKSLFINADRIAKGRWSTKVLLKPWSEYRFTGWIKTENLTSES